MGKTAKPRFARKSQLRAWALGKAGPILLRREMIAFLPACGLALLWIGPEAMVLLGFTAILVGWMTRPLPIPPEDDVLGQDPATGLPLPEQAPEIYDEMLADARGTGRPTGCLILSLDAPDQLLRQMYREDFDLLLRRIGERLEAQLRAGDRVIRWDGARFAVLLKPTPRLNLEGMIQLCGRLQDAVAEPFSIGARTVATSAHIGFRLIGRDALRSREAIAARTALSQAESAAEAARRDGPGATRAFSAATAHHEPVADRLAHEIADALEAGQIKTFFLPQISTDTGDICGLQAIPRWLHRSRGILRTRDIAPAAEAAGVTGRLAEVITFETLGTLRDFDSCDRQFGPVSLPLPLSLLEDPKLAERLAWECDRFGIVPARLQMIVGREVIPRLSEEIVARNLRRLRENGCRIELSGFGSGPASVETIHKLAPHRLRIDGELVAGVDQNAVHQRLVASIVSMAEGLGMETIATGLTSLAEHAMLAQLGCSAVQGRAIADPMPAEELIDWVERHREKLGTSPRIDTGKG